MRTVNSILDFHFSQVLWTKYASNALTLATINQNEESICELNRITESVGKATFIFKGNSLIPQVFRKFKLSLNKKNLTFSHFERKEVRTLTYCLSFSDSAYGAILEDEEELKILFKIFDSSWKDSFLVGLIQSLLINWSSDYKRSIEALSKYINSKLAIYQRSRTVLLSFKANLKYFDLKNGNLVLGNEIAIKQLMICEAEEYLSLPKDWYQYAYFSDAILSFYEKRRNNVVSIIDDLSEAIKRHNDSNLSKRIISKLIIQASEMNDLEFQGKIKDLAFNLIGDPGNISNWLPCNNSSAVEKAALTEARNILNEWITRQFINVFFEKCINDPRRKSFWLKYTKEITRFRVVGSTITKELLLADNRISDYVLPRFAKISSVSDNNAALMFVMKSYLFIEFSDLGAFYAYKLSNTSAPSIDEPNFKTTAELKTPSMDQLIYRTGNNIDEINDEGRLGHVGPNWEKIVAYWIKRTLGC